MIYFIKAGQDQLISIGNADDLPMTMDRLRRKYGRDPAPEVLALVSGRRDVERRILERFADARVRAPKSRTVPKRFRPTEELLGYIAELPKHPAMGSADMTRKGVWLPTVDVDEAAALIKRHFKPEYVAILAMRLTQRA